MSNLVACVDLQAGAADLGGDGHPDAESYVYKYVVYVGAAYYVSECYVSEHYVSKYFVSGYYVGYVSGYVDSAAP